MNYGTHTQTWMRTNNYTALKKSDNKIHILWFFLFKTPKQNKSIIKEGILMIIRGRGWGEMLEGKDLEEVWGLCWGGEEQKIGLFLIMVIGSRMYPHLNLSNWNFSVCCVLHINYTSIKAKF